MKLNVLAPQVLSQNGDAKDQILPGAQFGALSFFIS